MLKGIIGKKLGMTQIFHEEGGVVPVTVVQAGPCKVVQIKTSSREKYTAVQLGFEERDPKRVKKPLQGHFTKAQVPAFRYLKEFRVADADSFQVGQEITVEEFKVGDRVDVTGVSKGKGFMGVVKRWGFPWGPGHSWFHVSSGSGVDRSQFLPLAGMAGAKDGRAYGGSDDHPAEPGGNRRPAETEFAFDQRSRSGRGEGTSFDSRSQEKEIQGGRLKD